jgi:hypothetical protein
MATLSAANAAALQAAADAMTATNAVELPFDATIIERIAAVSASTGFETAGKFKNDARDNPISTLLRFAKFLGT